MASVAGWRKTIAKAVLGGSGMTDTDLVSALWGNQTQAPRKGSKELLEAYSTMPWLRSIFGRIGTSIASVPWCLYTSTDKSTGKVVTPSRVLRRSVLPAQRMKLYKAMRQDDTLKEVPNHPSLDLLDHGNPLFPGLTCVELTQNHLDLVGDGLWVFDRNGIPMNGSKQRGLPTDIWPMPPTWITQWPSKTYPFYNIASPRGSIIVPMQDVIRFRHPAPDDPYLRTSGIGMSMGDELETDEYAAKHLKTWFRNYARPDVIISAEGMSKGEVQKVEDHWLKKLTQQVNKPFFMNRKLQIDQLSHTFQEMQITELRAAERDILIHVVGMPPEILGIIENSNRSTIDAADYLMAKYIMVPRLEFLRINLQMHLIEQYDPRLILDYVSPVMEDDNFTLEVRKASPHSWTVDEWRQFGGSAPLENGKGQLYVVPMNVTAVKTLDELADIEPPAPPTPPGAIDDEDEDDDETDEDEDDDTEDEDDK